MSDLHPTAQDYARIAADYTRTRARLATLKQEREQARAAMRHALAEELLADPATTNVSLACRYGVTEGTVRNLRAGLIHEPATGRTDGC